MCMTAWPNASLLRRQKLAKKSIMNKKIGKNVNIIGFANFCQRVACGGVQPNACYGKILVFILEYNNNISCITIYFLHASVPYVSDVGQINWGRMG